MSINLTKGGRLDLTKGTGLQTATIGLGWDPQESSNGKAFDLDVSIFALGDGDKVVGEKYFVFYGNLKSPNSEIVHTGDNLTGNGSGDDETVLIDFSKMDPKIKRLVFVVTIYEGKERGQCFGQVKNSYIRIVDSKTNNEICKFDLGEDFSLETAVNFGEIYLKDGEWKFNATGTGTPGNLEDYVKLYIS